MRIDVALVDDVPLGVDTPARPRARPRHPRRPSASLKTHRHERRMPNRRSPSRASPAPIPTSPAATSIRDGEPCPAPTFEDAFAAVSDGTADLAMIPIENSIAGRVADIHHLLPASGLHIIGEHFLPIHFQLLAVKGATLDDDQDRAQPRPRARPVPQDHPQARAEAGGRRRHRRLGPRRSPSGTTRRAASPGAEPRRPRSTASTS